MNRSQVKFSFIGLLTPHSFFKPINLLYPLMLNCFYFFIPFVMWKLLRKILNLKLCFHVFVFLSRITGISMGCS